MCRGAIDLALYGRTSQAAHEAAEEMCVHPERVCRPHAEAMEAMMADAARQIQARRHEGE